MEFTLVQGFGHASEAALDLCGNPNKIDLTDNLDESIFHFTWAARF